MIRLQAKIRETKIPYQFSVRNFCRDASGWSATGTEAIMVLRHKQKTSPTALLSRRVPEKGDSPGTEAGLYSLPGSGGENSGCKPAESCPKNQPVCDRNSTYRILSRRPHQRTFPMTPYFTSAACHVQQSRFASIIIYGAPIFIMLRYPYNSCSYRILMQVSEPLNCFLVRI